MMKKLSVLVCMFILLAGCETYETYETNVSDYSKEYTVRANDWTKAVDEDFGVYFYRQIKEPNLTHEVFQYGIMQAFLYYVHPESNVPGLYQLPFDDYFVDGDYKWTEQVSCSFSPGYVTFMLKYDDQTHDTPSLDYTFQVRFLW